MGLPRTDDPGGTPISTRRDITIVSGGLWSGSGTAGAPVFTLDIDPVNVGDLLIFSIGSYNQTLTTPVAALSGGGVATWYTWNVTLNEPGIYGDSCWTSMWWGTSRRLIRNT